MAAAAAAAAAADEWGVKPHVAALLHATEDSEGKIQVGLQNVSELL
jgi:hypothetical protein